MCDISLNLKSKKQGFGYFQWNEQIHSEGKISEFLYWWETKTKKFDDKTGYEKNSWVTIRIICRYTKLHHVTVRKAIERLKEKFHILEVPGTKNARLFCNSEAPNVDYIRSRLKKDPPLADFYCKYNSKKYVDKILLHPKFNDDGWLIYPRTKFSPTVNRIRKKSHDTFDSIFVSVEEKRQTISKKNS